MFVSLFTYFSVFSSFFSLSLSPFVSEFTLYFPSSLCNLVKLTKFHVILLFLFNFLFLDSLNDVQTASSPVPMPQVALGLIPTTNVAPPQPVSTEQINLQFQRKLEELEQQVIMGSKQPDYWTADAMLLQIFFQFMILLLTACIFCDL